MITLLISTKKLNISHIFLEIYEISRYFEVLRLSFKLLKSAVLSAT